jgi:hypothetical protein
MRLLNASHSFGAFCLAAADMLTPGAIRGRQA